MDQFHIQRIAPPLTASFANNLFIQSPRRCGLTTFLKNNVAHDLYLNFQERDIFRKFSFQSQLLANIITENTRTIIIEHIEFWPQIIEQVKLLLEAKDIRFILTSSIGSLFELTGLDFEIYRFKQINYFLPSLNEINNNYKFEPYLQKGFLPEAIFKDYYESYLNDYVGLFLQDEILTHLKIRKIEAFSKFINSLATYNGQLFSYEQLAKDTLVSARTLREHFETLKKLNIVFELSCYQALNIKSSAKNKFYFFDTGFVNSLTNDFEIESNFYKKEIALKHLVFLELIKYKNQFKENLIIEFWEDYQSKKVDFVINKHWAVSVVNTNKPNPNNIRDLIKLTSSETHLKPLLVSLDEKAVSYQNLAHCSVSNFLKQLWSHALVKM